MSTVKVETLIENENWGKVIETLSVSPNQAQAWEKDKLPIHLACQNLNVPVDVINALIEAYPKSVELKSESGMETPLHFAVHHCPPAKLNVIQVLLEHYKQAVAEGDEVDRTPLYYHLLHSPLPSLEVTKMLLEANPHAVNSTNNRKWNPLHCAAARGHLEIAQYIIHLNPETLKKKNLFGKAPHEVADDNRNYELRNLLRQEEERIFGRRPTAIKEDSGQKQSPRDGSTRKKRHSNSISPPSKNTSPMSVDSSSKKTKKEDKHPEGATNTSSPQDMSLEIQEMSFESVESTESK